MLSVDLVNAVLSGGNLTITGDGSDERLAISGDGTPGDVVITGLTGSDNNPTQIDGSQNGRFIQGAADGSITLRGVTGNITVNLGSGDVDLTVIGLDVAKNLTINGGNGQDSVFIGQGIPISVPPFSIQPITSGLLTTGTTTSHPTSTVANPPATTGVSVGGDLDINLGNGQDVVSVGVSLADASSDGSTAGDSVHVAQNLNISVGNGSNDTINVGGQSSGSSGFTYGVPAPFTLPTIMFSSAEPTTNVATTNAVLASVSNAAATSSASSNSTSTSGTGVFIGGSLEIDGGSSSTGFDTVDLGFGYITDSPALVVSGDVDVLMGNAGAEVQIGEENEPGVTPPLDVIIGGNLNVTFGSTNSGFLEEVMSVAGNVTINGGSGTDSVYFYGPSTTVNSTIGGNLSITLGNADENTIIEQNLTIDGSEHVQIGSGFDELYFGATAFADGSSGNLSIGGNLDVVVSTGEVRFEAQDMTVGGTLAVTGGAISNSGGNFQSAVVASANPGLSGGGYHTAGSAAAGSSSAVDDVDLTDVTAARAFIFTGALGEDNFNIYQSTFGDLGVIVSSGPNNGLSIGNTTTTHSTTLIGLGTQDTFYGSGNSFANLYTQGLTPSPGSSLPSASPAVTPVASPFGAHAPTSNPAQLSLPRPRRPGVSVISPPLRLRQSRPRRSGSRTAFKPLSGPAGDDDPFG